MTTEEGIVVKLAHNTAWIKTQRHSACKACSARDSCHTTGSSGKEMEVEAINLAGAKVDDRVMIGFNTGSYLKITFLLYIFPILSMLAGAIIGHKLAPQYNINSSLAAALLGFSAFFLAFLFIKMREKKLAQNEKYRAKIVRILKPRRTRV